MDIPARVDYAVRALLMLASHDGETLALETIAVEQGIPSRYLDSVMAILRRGGLVRGRRGPGGGYTLTRSAEAITLGAVVRAAGGPLLLVAGLRPEEIAHSGVAGRIPQLWMALECGLRAILDGTTLAELLPGQGSMAGRAAGGDATWHDLAAIVAGGE